MKQCISCLSEGVTNVIQNNRIFYFCPTCQKRNTRCIDYGIDFQTELLNGFKIHISIAALIKDNDGKILLINRRDYPFGLSLPVGHVFEGEKLPHALDRKILEETGLSCKNHEPILKETFIDHCKYGTDLHQWNVFGCITTGQIIPGYESSEIIWKKINDLTDSNLTAQTRYILSRLGLINKKFAEESKLSFKDYLELNKPTEKIEESSLLQSLPFPAIISDQHGEFVEINQYAERFLKALSNEKQEIYPLLKTLSNKVFTTQIEATEIYSIKSGEVYQIIANPFIDNQGTKKVSIILKRTLVENDPNLINSISYQSTKALNASNNSKIVIKNIMKQLIYYLNAHSCTLFQFSNNDEKITKSFRISECHSEQKLDHLLVDKEAKIAQKVLQTCTEIVKENKVENQKEQYITIGIPLVQNNEKLGALIIKKTKPKFMAERDMKLIQSIAGKITIAIQTEKLYHALVYERNMLRKILASTSNSIILFDKDKQPAFINREAKKVIKGNQFDQNITDSFAKNLNYVYKSKKARTFDFELKEPYRYFKTSLYPIADKSTGKIEVIAVCNDMTDLKLNELAIAKENEKISSIMNNTVEGILVFDNDYNIVLSNKAMSLADNFIPKNQKEKLSVFAKLISNQRKEAGKSYQEIKLKDIDDEVYWLGTAFSSIELDNRELTIAVIHDIMKEKILEQKQKDFIHTITHELRTPITAIKGYISMILHGDAGPITSRQRVFFGKAYSSTERLVGLVEDILNSSKVENEIFHKEEFDPAALLNELEDDFCSKAKQKGIGLKIEKLKPGSKLIGDKEKTRQAVANLIDNAIKYTAKGNVSLSYEPKEKNGEITISDTGIGLSRKDTKMVFDKFYRSPNRLPNEPGTGLGLYIVKNIIDKQNGKIIVNSKIGKGSDFKILLPLAK